MAKDLKIRASSLPTLFACRRMWVEKTMHDGDELGGAPAQTGSIVHAGINAYHQSKKRKVDDRIAEGYAAMKRIHKDKYKGGDLAAAEVLFHSWCCEEQSSGIGTLIGSEIELRFKWPVFYSPQSLIAWSKAKGKKPIPDEEMTITGHLDEIRLLDDVGYVNDEKTGWTPADAMTGEYVPQIAGYVVGAKLSDKFPQIAKWRGFIKRTRDIGTSDPYRYKVISSFEQAERIMLQASLLAGQLASGYIAHTPGRHCKNCPLNGFPDCEQGHVRPPKSAGGKGAGKKTIPLTVRKPLKLSF